MSTMNVKSLSTLSQLDFNELLSVLREGQNKAEYHPKKHKKQSYAAQNRAAKNVKRLTQEKRNNKKEKQKGEGVLFKGLTGMN